MPRVKLDPLYRRKLLREKIVGRRKTLRISQSDMGDLLGINQSAYSKKEKSCEFNVDDLNVLFKTLDFTDKEILKLFRD